MTQSRSRELESLVRKLNRKNLVDWVEEMRLGKLAYDHLLACVRARTLNRNQLANALRALFRLRMHGSEDEVFAVFRGLMNDGEIRVRSAAVGLLIGMMRLHKFVPPFQPDDCVNEIRAAMALGLYNPPASLAKDFVAQYGATAGA
jgi:hypothetical protein